MGSQGEPSFFLPLGSIVSYSAFKSCAMRAVESRAPSGAPALRPQTSGDSWPSSLSLPCLQSTSFSATSEVLEMPLPHCTSPSSLRCPSCAVVFGGVNSIKSHIQASHCEVFHKCPICPMAFKSAPSAHAHLYSQHPSFLTQQAK